MKLIDKCSSCKHLDENDKYHYGYAKCNKIEEIEGVVSIDSQGWGKVKIADANEFGCIAWEAKDE